LFLDLDRFKPVNDAFGHETGDRVLKQIAHRLTTVLPPRSLAARVGGDEFVAAVPLTTAREIAAICARITTSISAPILLESTEIVVG
ncbi:GGDEF domain-containing protein, partial [Mycobacterium tuberculosis]|nr:GGDEF domain-containing protein [Mycobacterium tuberculosis]